MKFTLLILSFLLLSSISFASWSVFQNDDSVSQCNFSGFLTSTTSSTADNCDNVFISIKSKEEKQLHFIEINMEIIAEEMSQGKGLFLADYARVLGCSEHSVVDFSTITQKQTKSIFMKRNDARSILLRTQNIIHNNSELSQSCFS
jgi:hypothetical protein